MLGQCKKVLRTLKNSTVGRARAVTGLLAPVLREGLPVQAREPHRMQALPCVSLCGGLGYMCL